jgi:hypothetical protein
MDPDTILASLNFIQKVKPKIIMVSGGEPFDSPNCLNILDSLLTLGYSGRQILVTSNGLALQKDSALRDVVAKMGVSVQIVNDDRYYPTKVVIEDPRFTVEYNLPIPLFLAGRALTNNLDCHTFKYSPQCFNLRSLARSKQFIDLASTIHYLEELGKFCIPCIDSDGTFKLGETILCKSIGTVHDDPKELFNRIMIHKCDNCGLTKNLSAIRKLAIGEI